MKKLLFLILISLPVLAQAQTIDLGNTVYSTGGVVSTEEHENYQNLTPKGKKCYDSLNTKYAPLDNQTISITPYYMKPGVKYQTFIQVYGQEIMLLKYKFFHNEDGGHGAKMIKETKIYPK